MKLNVIIAEISTFLLFIAGTSYAAESVTRTKDEIRSLFNTAVSSYPEISEKAKIADENKKLEILKLEISDYLNLARKLEEQHQYRRAVDCYEKILELCQDPGLKKFIIMKNKELKKLVLKTKKSASRKIAKEKKSLLCARKPTASSKISNLEKQHSRRSELLYELQGKLKKLEKNNDEY